MVIKLASGKLTNLMRQKNKIQEELKELSIACGNKIRSLENKIEDYKKELNKKDKEIEELKLQVEELTNG